MQSLFLAQIALYNFRNYKQSQFEFHRGLNFLIGPNGAGKTNLMEAIAYLAYGRSFRYQQDRELINFNHTHFYLQGKLYRQGQWIELSLSYRPGNKELRINHAPQRLLNLLGTMPAVTFVPDDLYLVKGPPVVRRRFLDRQISQVDRSYCYTLLTYRRVLRQRNLLLRQIKAGRNKGEELDPWDLQLVAMGVPLVKKRREVLTRWSSVAGEYYEILASGQAKMSLIYQPSLKDEEDWLRALSRNREKEIAAGTTLWGPHRDDFAFQIQGRAGRHFASQGEQRSLVLALKIAEVVYFTEVLRFTPLLLLDDVFSELDARRQRALLNLVKDKGQIFISTTDSSLLPGEMVHTGAVIQLTPP
ncbi:MAG: DNA replication/repair protein RecF [Moorellaceae bacterium]